MWPILSVFGIKVLEGAAGMAGGLALKKALDGGLSGLAGGFNPFNLSDPFGLKEDEARADMDAERARADAAIARARKEAAAKEKAAQKSGDAKAAQAANEARLQAEIVYRDKLAALERANEVRYRDAVRRGDKQAAAAAMASQQRNDVAKKLARAESEIRLLTAQKAQEGSDVSKLASMLDLMQKVKQLTIQGADVPRFDAAGVSRDVDAVTSGDPSDLDAFLMYEAAPGEGMSGPLYPVTLVTVREV